MYDMPPSFERFGSHISIKWGFSKEAYDILASGQIEGVVLEVGDWSDLRWLSEFKDNLTYLSIQSKDIDWQSIGNLTELLALRIGSDFKFKFDFSVLKKLKWLKMYSRRDYGESMFQLPNLESLTIVGWKGDDLAPVSSLKHLKYLHLVDTRVLKSLRGLERLDCLEGLDINVANNLNDISAIGSLIQLKSLKLANCKRIASYDSLKNNKNLQSLIISKTSDIESLEILNGMEKLDYLAFGSGTKVVDGDLEILYRLKSLRHCRYTNARHYNIKKKDFDAHQFGKIWL